MPMRPWREAAAVYANPRLLAILGMGFASGLPFLLTTTTLTYWLAKVGLDKTSIGLFALVGLPYSLKFLWAPALDHVRLPGLSRLGRRRSWMLLAQAALVAAILALGVTDPSVTPLATAALALAIALASATLDVAVDAYRIEVLAPHEQGAGAAATQTGYRAALLLAGAGATALSDFVPWPAVFAALAALVILGMGFVLLSPEPQASPGGPPHASAEGARSEPKASEGGLPQGLSFEHALLAPLRDLMSRPQWVAILAFAVLYKFGDSVAGVMASPFFVDLGFSGVEIASVTKVLGLVASVVGIGAGGVLVARTGVFRALVWGGILQATTNLLYSGLAGVGHDVALLAVAIAADNFTGGLASAAFVAYLSGLCRREFTATQYALLTSLMAAGRTTLSAGGGWLATQMDWAGFFAVTALLALPGLALLARLSRTHELREG
jgi:PAT family beta-lactamase induction signal transducer AmpG